MRGIIELVNAEWEQVVPSLNISPCELFAGNRAAYEVALTFIRTAGTWDDLVDRDVLVTPAEIHLSYIGILHDLELNPFYVQHRPQLFSLVTTSILGYITANLYEDTQDEHGMELGHFLRYSPALIVGYLVYLCQGINGALHIWPTLMKALCSERIDNYVAEILSRGKDDAE